MIPFRSLFNRLSPAGVGGRLSIFIFHRVLPQPDELFPGEPDAARFDQMLGWLGQWFNVLPLDGAIAALQQNALPARAASITFDDGYEDNFSIAMPLLKKHGMSATFFIATGFLDGGRMWNDTVIESVRHCSLPVLDLAPLGLGAYPVVSTAERQLAIADIIGKIKYHAPAPRLEITERIAELAAVNPSSTLMMSSLQVKEMADAGMQIGAHTVSHPILARTTLDDARHEIVSGRDRLEEIIGARVPLFAYPNGKPGQDYLPEHVDLVRELGFTAAVSTAWGAANNGGDIFQLPRFTPWDQQRWRFGVRLLKNLAAA